jgi:hypothetical protein
MAKLPASGSISITQINSLSSFVSNTTSIDSRSRNYMGDYTVTGRASASFGICMPNMVINKNTGALAKNSDYWVYTGSDQPWRPYSFSQFYEAYNGKPVLTVTVVGTGVAGSGILRAVGSNSDAYVNSSTPYSFFSTSTNAWSVATLANGTRYDYSVSNGTYRIWIRDYYNCGTGKEFPTNPLFSYP